MSGEGTDTDVKRLPARRLNKAAHAYVPGLLLGLWSAISLLEVELRMCRGVVLAELVAVCTLPVIWFVVQVLTLKLCILVSVVLLRLWKQPVERSHGVVGAVLVVLCAALAFWQTRSYAPSAQTIGAVGLAALALCAAWRLLTATRAHPR